MQVGTSITSISFLATTIIFKRRNTKLSVAPPPNTAKRLALLRVPKQNIPRIKRSLRKIVAKRGRLSSRERGGRENETSKLSVNFYLERPQ
jgi:hypothetical protein